MEQGVKAAPAQRAAGYKGSTESGSAPKTYVSISRRARISGVISIHFHKTTRGVRADAKDVDARGKTGGNDDAERWMDGCVSDDGCASRGGDGGMEELDAAARRTTTTRFKRRRLTIDDDARRAGDPARLATCTSSA